MTDLPNIPSAEKITADWGERCPDHDPDCFCCQMWAMHDRIQELQMQLVLSKPVYSRRQLEQRLADAESKLAEARAEALEPAHGEDNQPRYTTKRLRDEIAKARAYARMEALEEAAKVADDFSVTTYMHWDSELEEPVKRKARDGASIAAAIRSLKEHQP